MSNALVQLNAIETALAEAKTIAEVKNIRNQAEAMRQCFRLAEYGLEMQNDAAEVKLRAERRAGKILQEMRERGELASHGGSRSHDAMLTLKDIGLTKDQSHHWGLEIKVPPERFEQYVTKTKTEGKELTSAGLLRIAKRLGTMTVMGSSESPEWYTPQRIIDLTLELFNGTIDTDPCSNSKTNPAVPATFLYTKQDDGLTQIWHGAVYMNPPYGSEIPQWIDALVSKYESGELREAIALLPGRTDTRWFQPLYAHPICMVRGRLQFQNSPHSAPFPSVIVYLGSNRIGFINIFKELGPIMERVDEYL